MQKSKSLSLSDIDQLRIINMVNAKITPLKFKYLEHKNTLLKHARKLSHDQPNLPKLKRNDQQSEQEYQRFNKRISISTYIARTSPKQKLSRKTIGGQPRNSILDTKYMIKEENHLMSLLNQSGEKQNILLFQTHMDQTIQQKNKKLASDFFLLQKKKMLKNVKSQIEKQKSMFFEQIIFKKKRQKQKQQILKKKYNTQLQEGFKQKGFKKMRNSQYVECSNAQGQINQQQVMKNESSQKFISMINRSESIEQSLKHDLLTEHEDLKKIRQYIQFFKQDMYDNRKSHITQYFQNQQQTSKFVICPEGMSNKYFNKSRNRKGRRNSDSQCRLEYGDEEVDNALKQKGKVTWNGSKILFGQKDAFKVNEQLNRQSIQEINSQVFDPVLTNAKMRIRSNHKKIVSLGKMQKVSKISNEAKYPSVD